MPKVSFFSLPEVMVDRTQREVTEILRPVHLAITKLIVAQGHNVVFRLPLDELINAMEAPLLLPYRECVIQTGMWGLKLKIERSADTEGEKTWIKKANVWYRMLETAGDQAEIGFKEPDEPDESLFRPASKSQLPYPDGWFAGTEMLLCAIRLNAQQALHEAIVAEREFNPRHFDADGYYVGPSRI